MDKSCCNLYEYIEMDSSIEYYKKLLRSQDVDSNIVVIVVGIVVIIVTAVLWRILRGQGSRKTGILLLGCSDAGKTNIFAQLISGKKPNTQTSLKENSASYTVEELKNKPVFTVYDLPGHESIRYQYVEKFKDNARGIIFVVDSSSFQSDHQDVAEFLFRIFTDKSIWKSAPSICIACNKQDLLLAKSKRVIYSKLEEELNTLRKTQSAALASTEEGGENSIYLGVKGKDFKFQQLSKLKVEFLECSTEASEEYPSARLDEIKSWIASLSR